VDALIYLFFDWHSLLDNLFMYVSVIFLLPFGFTFFILFYSTFYFYCLETLVV
jgi:hypothetical protein